MNYEDPLVKKEAKKYKKFLESFTINPGSFKFNNRNYFMVNYYRGKKMTDCAVVSPTSNAGKNEYLEAFDALLEYAELTTLIITHAGERAASDMYAFTTMQKFLSDVLSEAESHLLQKSKNVFEYCLERINLILELQDRLLEIYQYFYRETKKFHDGELEYFTIQDMEDAANYLGEVGYIQFKQVVAIYEFIPKFKYIKELNNPEVEKYKDNVVERYLAEFSKGEDEQRKNLENVTYQPNMAELTKEEHIEVEKKEFYNNLDETNALSRKELRYPK